MMAVLTIPITVHTDGRAHTQTQPQIDTHTQCHTTSLSYTRTVHTHTVHIHTLTHSLCLSTHTHLLERTNWDALMWGSDMSGSLAGAGGSSYTNTGWV